MVARKRGKTSPVLPAPLAPLAHRFFPGHFREHPSRPASGLPSPVFPERESRPPRRRCRHREPTAPTVWPARFREALLAQAADETPAAHAYMPNNGYPQVREAVAVQIGAEQGVALSGAEILMTCGAAGALNVVMKSLLDPGDDLIFVQDQLPELGKLTQPEQRYIRKG